MRLMHLNKWLRVGIPLLLLSLASLVIYNAFHGLSEKLTAQDWPMQDFPRSPQETQGEHDIHYKLYETKSKRSNIISLAVVEEHHEVIPYWFKAAMMGIIPKSGNTLIHFDGHSDMAPPRYDPRMPFFHWPTTETQMESLMQANDVFIQAAMITGLISRVIFIKPSWDKNDNTTYSKTDVDIGLVSLNDSTEPAFCSCMSMPSEKLRECIFYKPLSKDSVSDVGNSAEDDEFVTTDDVEGFKPSRRCILETVVDHVALKVLKTKPDWIGASGNIILDIDEDFFGVELAGQSLVDAGLDWEKVKTFDFSLRRIFCPRQIYHEDLGNRMIRELVELFIRRCRHSVQSDDEICRASVKATGLVVHRLVLAFWKSDEQIFCPRNSQDLLEVVGEMTLVLYEFSLNHLRELMEFGFCFETSPASVTFRDAGHGSLGMCQGSNTPNASIVFLHQPDAAEIRTRTAQLRNMLEVIDARHRPNVVTLCRSVRDGYTPRRFFSSIEANILDIFKDLPGHYEVVYDENLYGGKGGWPNRHKKT